MVARVFWVVARWLLTALSQNILIPGKKSFLSFIAVQDELCVKVSYL